MTINKQVLMYHVWDPKVPTEAVQAGLHECRDMATAAFLESADIPLKCCDGEGWYTWPPLDVDANGCLDLRLSKETYKTTKRDLLGD